MNHKNYRCAVCGAANCKLWREPAVFASHVVLRCAPCAARQADKDISTLDATGKRDSEHGKTDQIGGWLPAVPTEDGSTYWGYTSVPDEGCKWWRDLPSLPLHDPAKEDRP